MYTKVELQSSWRLPYSSVKIRLDMLQATWDFHKKRICPEEMKDWELKICRRCSKSGGICKFDKKQVVIARCFLESRFNSCSEIRDTLLHEIAHIIAGPRAGHGPGWQNVARILGCSGRVYHKMLSVKQLENMGVK